MNSSSIISKNLKLIISPISLILSIIAIVVSMKSCYYAKLSVTPKIVINKIEKLICGSWGHKSGVILHELVFTNIGSADVSILSFEVKVEYKDVVVIKKSHDIFNTELISPQTSYEFSVKPIINKLMIGFVDVKVGNSFNSFLDKYNLTDEMGSMDFLSVNSINFPVKIEKNQTIRMIAVQCFNSEYLNLKLLPPHEPNPNVFEPIPPREYSPTYLTYSFQLSTGEKIITRRIECFYYELVKNLS